MRFRETARRSRYGHAGPRAAIFIALAGSLAVCAPGTSATGAKARAPLSRRDLCCLPYSETHSLGRESIPILKSMLSDPSEKERWPRIVGTIAYVGVPESFVVLRDFMWNRFSGVVDDDTSEGVNSRLRPRGAVGVPMGRGRRLSWGPEAPACGRGSGDQLSAVC